MNLACGPNGVGMSKEENSIFGFARKPDSQVISKSAVWNVIDFSACLLKFRPGESREAVDQQLVGAW